MRFLTLAPLAAWAACAALGQPARDVASVKPALAVPEAPAGLFTYPGGRVAATNCTLKMLIHDAYSIEPYRILGGPAWAGEDRFDIEARVPASSDASHPAPESIKTPPSPEMRSMLQSLLAEQFRLAVHPQTIRGSVYALVVAKGGVKLKPPAGAAPPLVSFGRTGSPNSEAASYVLTGRNVSMALFTARLAAVLYRPVLDQTGLSGSYDFQAEYAADDSSPDAALPLSRALEEQLGLKLETRPGPIELLMIDHAEKPATPTPSAR